MHPVSDEFDDRLPAGRCRERGGDGPRGARVQHGHPVEQVCRSSAAQRALRCRVSAARAVWRRSPCDRYTARHAALAWRVRRVGRAGKFGGVGQGAHVARPGVQQPAEQRRDRGRGGQPGPARLLGRVRGTVPPGGYAAAAGLHEARADVERRKQLGLGGGDQAGHERRGAVGAVVRRRRPGPHAGSASGKPKPAAPWQWTSTRPGRTVPSTSRAAGHPSPSTHSPASPTQEIRPSSTATTASVENQSRCHEPPAHDVPRRPPVTWHLLHRVAARAAAPTTPAANPVGRRRSRGGLEARGAFEPGAHGREQRLAGTGQPAAEDDQRWRQQGTHDQQRVAEGIGGLLPYLLGDGVGAQALGHPGRPVHRVPAARRVGVGDGARGGDRLEASALPADARRPAGSYDDVAELARLTGAPADEGAAGHEGHGRDAGADHHDREVAPRRGPRRSATRRSPAAVTSCTIVTGSPRAAATGAATGMSCQARFAARTPTPRSTSTMPGTGQADPVRPTGEGEPDRSRRARSMTAESTAGAVRSGRWGAEAGGRSHLSRRVDDLCLDAWSRPTSTARTHPGTHARMIERVRLRGSSGSSPAARARHQAEPVHADQVGHRVAVGVLEVPAGGPDLFGQAVGTVAEGPDDPPGRG